MFRLFSTRMQPKNKKNIGNMEKRLGKVEDEGFLKNEGKAFQGRKFNDKFFWF